MLDLGPIKARHAAATQPKWELLYQPASDGDDAFEPQEPMGVGYYVDELNDFEAIVVLSDNVESNNDTSDLAFIAAAHADIPALIAEVERLRAGEAV